MTTTVLTNDLSARSISAVSLKTAARLWFLVAVIGQWAFLYYIVAFYASPTLQGNFRAWSRNTDLFKGYVAGDTLGNLSFGAHVMLAAVIAFGGALQLVPWIRTRAMPIHCWNGRVFMLTALGASLSGLYLVWVRGGPNLIGALTISQNALLIIGFVILAWRSARARRIEAHRRWAMRAYLVANGQWFFRVGLFGMMLFNRAWVGPFYLFWGVGCYLVPLGVLELYLRIQDRAGSRARVAMAGGLLVLTALMGIGIVGVYLVAWRPLLVG